MDLGQEIDPNNDEVFVSGLPLDVTEEEIAEYFGQIGIIKEVCWKHRVLAELTLSKFDHL